MYVISESTQVTTNDSKFVTLIVWTHENNEISNLIS